MGHTTHLLRNIGGTEGGIEETQLNAIIFSHGAKHFPCHLLTPHRVVPCDRPVTGPI
jgi:hypothetical protein